MEKFTVSKKGTKKVICGIAYSEEAEEFLVGGPREHKEKVLSMLKLMDVSPEKLEEKIKVDSYKMRLRVDVTQDTWKEFTGRLSSFYDMTAVDSLGKKGK